MTHTYTLCYNEITTFENGTLLNWTTKTEIILRFRLLTGSFNDLKRVLNIVDKYIGVFVHVNIDAERKGKRGRYIVINQ